MTDELARAIAEHLDNHPEPAEAGIDDIAEALDADPEAVRDTLDEWRRDGDEITHVGPGGGGGWIPS